MKRNNFKTLSLCLCLALILGMLSGCWLDDDESYDIASVDIDLKTRAEDESSGGNANDASYYQDVWHSGESFDDIEYEHYDFSDFQTLADRIYKFASSGGSAEKFQVADNQIVNELYYIYTLYSLADIRYMQDSSDESAAEQEYMSEIVNDAVDEYWSAMAAVAVSENASLLDDCYADWQIEQFASYDGTDYDDWESEMLEKETELVQEYYSLISEDDPDYDEICRVYIDLINLRNSMAEAYGYASYAEYCYDSVYSRDYSPTEAQQLWSIAKEYFCLLADDLFFEIAESSYTPDVDYSPESILKVMAEVLPKISDGLYDAYKVMLDRGLYDISDSDEKQQTGFTTRLYYENLPFIFNKPDNSYYDYGTMFHEFGHFANFYYTESDLLFGVSDNDICELQSQGLEILATYFYEDVFGEENGEIMAEEALLNILYSVVDGCLHDEFQQKVYAEENLTSDRVKEIYAEVYEDYGYSEYDGYELEWADVQHNFEYPFYYISYAVSAIPALELYALMQDSFGEAADKYLEISAMDTESYYFSEAISKVGFGNVFDEDTAQEIFDSLC